MTSLKQGVLILKKGRGIKSDQFEEGNVVNDEGTRSNKHQASCRKCKTGFDWGHGGGMSAQKVWFETDKVHSEVGYPETLGGAWWEYQGTLMTTLPTGN